MYLFNFSHIYHLQNCSTLPPPISAWCNVYRFPGSPNSQFLENMYPLNPCISRYGSDQVFNYMLDDIYKMSNVNGVGT